MHTMKPPFDNCRSYDGISAFFEQHNGIQRNARYRLGCASNGRKWADP